MTLVELLNKYRDRDVILAQKRNINGTQQILGYYYANAKGSPLFLLDDNQKYYMSSNCGRVYWNPTQKDMTSNEWYIVREGKPFGVNKHDIGDGLVILRENRK